MTKFQSIISSMIIIIVVFASILQFHHHDQSGMICLNANHACHTVIKSNNLSHECCSQTPEDHHQNDDENCSLKISIAKANKSFSLQDHQFLFIVLHDIVSLCIADGITTEQKLPIRDNNLILPETHASSSLLRAPPVV